MRNLNDREKRTLRLAAIGVALYLVVFFGVRLWKQGEGRRSAYQQLVSEAETLQREFQRYETKVLEAEKLKATFRIEPARLSKATLVSEASAAIQRTAKSGGLQLGPVRESPARSAAREVSSMQIEGTGPVPAVMGFIHRLGAIGYPLILDSVQMTRDPTKPGMLKISLTVVILDFEQWQKKKGAA